jgi:SAM-dependent methyltransferase
MGSAFELVTQLGAEARARGAAQSVAQFDNPATHAQYTVPYEVTRRHVRPGDSVLDWGCGNGHYSLLLETLGAKVTGFSFEPRPELMARSREFTFVAGREDEPRTLPFPAAAFDCVCSVGVLEHVWETGGDEPSSLAELARVLKPGGVFLTFHFPNRLGWIEPAFRAIGLGKYYHRRRYDEAQIQKLWNDAGFAVVEVGTYNFLPRNQLRSLPRVLRSRHAFARAYDALDRALGAVLGQFNTNYFVVGRRRSP